MKRSVVSVLSICVVQRLCTCTLWTSCLFQYLKIKLKSQASWNRTVLKFGSKNQLNVHNNLSILFCDFPLIARSGKCHVTISLTDAAHLQYSVEFALHPQHEASCDSEIQTGKDFKNKFRKQLESSPTTSLNSEGKEETLGCLKSWTELKKNEDGHWICWFTRTLYCVFIWTIVYLHSVCNSKSPIGREQIKTL